MACEKLVLFSQLLIIKGPSTCPLKSTIFAQMVLVRKNRKLAQNNTICLLRESIFARTNLSMSTLLQLQRIQNSTYQKVLYKLGSKTYIICLIQIPAFHLSFIFVNQYFRYFPYVTWSIPKKRHVLRKVITCPSRSIQIKQTYQLFPFVLNWICLRLLLRVDLADFFYSLLVCPHTSRFAQLRDRIKFHAYAHIDMFIVIM